MSNNFEPSYDGDLAAVGGWLAVLFALISLTLLSMGAATLKGCLH